MRDTMYLGTTPPDENCAQVRSEGYQQRAREECKAYIALLRRVLGLEPSGASLVVTSNPHDFGDYLAVSCGYDPNVQEAIDYAFRCESEGPTTRDEQAREELSQSLTRKEPP